MSEDLFREDSYLKSCESEVLAVTEGGILLDRTVFYPTGGGQPGDTGSVGGVPIINTIKDPDTGAILHVPEDGAALPQVGDIVTAEIDWQRRYAHMRMHTAMHLVCALIDGDVTGGQVGAEKSRLDFNLAESPDKEALGQALGALIAEDHPVSISSITDAELDANPELVRTMSVQPPRGAGRIRIIDVDGVDLQPCGGTHVKSTGEIGRMRIGKIENKGKQNRRINIHFAE